MGRPTWRVQAVFADGSDDGGGFAYTIGLGDRGLHELYITDQPTHGDDLGDGFLLSTRDMGGVLNRLAERRVTGRFGNREEVTEQLDSGSTTITFSLGRPVPRADVEAWGARSAMVTPVRWSLVRQPMGSPTRVPRDLVPGYLAEYARIADECDPTIAVDGGYRPSHDPKFSVGQPYGPLTPLVRVHARAMAGTPQLLRLAEASLLVLLSDDQFDTRAAAMSAVARRHGRSDAIESLPVLAAAVFDRIQRRPGWGAVAADVSTRFRVDDAELVGVAVGRALLCSLMGLALDDVLPTTAAVPAQAPWRWVLAHQAGLVPPRWRPSMSTVRDLRWSLEHLDEDEVIEFASEAEWLARRHFADEAPIILSRLIHHGAFPPQLVDVLPPAAQVEVSAPERRGIEAFVCLITAVLEGLYELTADQASAINDLIGLDLTAGGEAA